MTQESISDETGKESTNSEPEENRIVTDVTLEEARTLFRKTKVYEDSLKMLD